MNNTILSLMITTCLSFSINGYAEEDREENKENEVQILCESEEQDNEENNDEFSVIASDDEESDDENSDEFSVIASDDEDSDDEDSDDEDNLLAKCVNGKCPKEKIESLRKERQERYNDEEEEANQLA